MLTSVLFVTLFSLVITQNALGQCAAGVAGCPPAPGGGGERRKKPTQTLAPTPVPTATATLVPGAAVLPPPPALSGGVPSGPANPGNPNPVSPPNPGPLEWLLANPWGLVIFMGLIAIFAGIYYFFGHGPRGHTLIGSTGGGAPGDLVNDVETAFRGDPFKKESPGGADANLTFTRQDLAHDVQNVTITRQDLTGGTQNFTVNRQDLGNLENGTIDVRDIGETGGTL